MVSRLHSLKSGSAVASDVGLPPGPEDLDPLKPSVAKHYDGRCLAETCEVSLPIGRTAPKLLAGTPSADQKRLL